jgi:hypothetical protein
MAKIKTIPCVVKEYKTNGQFMVESLIENIHREDLSPTEKGKFCLEIKNKMKLKNNEEISKVINVHSQMVARWVDDVEFRNSHQGGKGILHSTIRATKSLEDKDREKVG